MVKTKAVNKVVKAKQAAPPKPVTKKVKLVEKVQQCASLDGALDLIDSLKRKKVTGYLNAVWTVRWEEPKTP